MWPRDSDLTELKAAVIALDLPFRVRPFWFEHGKHDRAIALAEGFEAVDADHVYPKNEKTRKMALQWFFGLIDLLQAHTVESKMKAIFGEETREVDPSESPWTNPSKDTPPWP